MHETITGNPVINLNKVTLEILASYVVGETLSNEQVELIPKVTPANMASLATARSLKNGFKVFNTSTNEISSWTGACWIIINNSAAAKLVSNSADGQVIIKISDTEPPIAGQSLVATSPTTATWQTVTTGSGGTPSYNSSYITLIGDGTSTSITVVHSLNTESIIYGVWETTGSKQSVDATVSIVSVNAITLHFHAAPAYQSLKVIIISSVSTSVINSSSGLPSQTGNASKYLQTNGNTVSWQVVDTLPSQQYQSGKFLSTNGTTSFWEVVPTWMANPMIYPGDLIIGGEDGAAGRLGIGSIGKVLTVVSGNILGWSDLVPDSALQSGKFLYTDGTSNSWASIRQLPTINAGTINKILSNDGTSSSWITNTAPPSVSGQGTKFLTNDGSVTSWSFISQVPSTTGHAGKLLTNDGSSYSWNTLISILPSILNQDNKVLTTDGTTISWEVSPSGFADPMTSIGDLITRNGSNVTTRLSRGSTGQFLSTAANGTLVWSSDILTNPMTSVGDLLIGSTGGAPTRLGISASGYFLGSNGSTPTWVQGNLIPTVSGYTDHWLHSNGTTASWQAITQIPTQTGNNTKFLTTDGSTLSWATVPSGFSNPMTSAGDMITGTSGGAAARLIPGSNGQILTIVANAPAWSNNVIGLPTQTGNTGRHLYTNGSSAFWEQVYQVPTVVNKSGLFLGNDGVNYSWVTLPNQLPDITGQAGKYLSTNGIISSWVPYEGLPELTDNSGKILSTDGITAFWIDPAGGSGVVLSRIPIQVTSSSLAVLAGEIKTVDTTCKTFELLQITADSPCRVRIYATHAAATADYSRLASLDPMGNHKMYVEMILTQANLSWTNTPVPTCSNQDDTVNTNIYIAIQNTGVTTKAIVLDLSLLKKE